MQQQSLQKINWKHRFSHGGVLRQKRVGRKARPLSTKESLHLVLKGNRDCVPGGFRTYRRFALIHQILQKYQFKFFIRVEQVSIQGDHLHLLIRTSRRSNYVSFFRVLAGQIAQRFEAEGLLTLPVTDTPDFIASRAPKARASALRAVRKLWRYRSFSRLVRGWNAYQVVTDYIQLNEQEALGTIPYWKLRLKGLSSVDWKLLWT